MANKHSPAGAQRFLAVKARQRDRGGECVCTVGMGCRHCQRRSRTRCGSKLRSRALSVFWCLSLNNHLIIWHFVGKPVPAASPLNAAITRFMYKINPVTNNPCRTECLVSCG